MFYLIKTPRVVEKYLFPRYLWRIADKEKNIYLSFDDGPHPTITNFVLDQLKRFNAKASFFCIGKNVLAYPEIYKRIIYEGHSVGNHTHDHLNGWNVSDAVYLKNVTKASDCIDSKLFRPPYGKITGFQSKHVMETLHYHIIMWTVLSGDFDIRLSPEDCYKNVVRTASAGSIVVFHDSDKALKRMSYALPRTLEYFSEKGYSFKNIIP